MKLTDLKVRKYLDVLKSGAPAPGGGSASALSGAQGLALLLMVLELTLGNEKYAEFHEICLSAKEKAHTLLSALTSAVDEDTEAFNLVSGAYKMPKSTEDEKVKRSAAIQEGTVKSTEVPLSVMNDANEGLNIIAGLAGKTNPAAMSDLGVAVLHLLISVRGAWLNVKINLPVLKDREKAKNYAEAGQRLCDLAEETAAELYNYCHTALEI